MYFVILVCLAFAMLYGGWSYKSAKDIIIDNQNYEHIDQKQERQFNEWDLDRMYKYHFAFGSLFFVLVLVYLFMCIKWENAPSETQGATPSFNKDLEVSASPTPKEFPSEIPSLNPDIMRNFCLRKNLNHRP
jgi:hypothetical protein